MYSNSYRYHDPVAVHTRAVNRMTVILAMMITGAVYATVGFDDLLKITVDFIR